jgi:hypothetical protein
MQPTAGRNITGNFDPTIHGYHGKTHTTLPNELQEIFDVKFINAANELGGNFQYNLDTNSGKPLGAGRCFERFKYWLIKVTRGSVDADYNWWRREEQFCYIVSYKGCS